MKALLDFFREFGEVNLCDSRFRFDHDAIRLDTSNRGIFVFFAINGFEVLAESGRHEQQDEKRENFCVHLSRLELILCSHIPDLSVKKKFRVVVMLSEAKHRWSNSAEHEQFQ